MSKHTPQKTDGVPELNPLCAECYMRDQKVEDEQLKKQLCEACYNNRVNRLELRND